MPPIQFAPYMDETKTVSAQGTSKPPVYSHPVVPDASHSQEAGAVPEETRAVAQVEQVAMPVDAAGERAGHGGEKIPFSLKILGILFDTYILLEQMCIRDSLKR